LLEPALLHALMKRIALTFDNGPTPEVTGAVLAILRARGIKATFFVVGASLADPRGPALLDEIAAEGHWIGTHTLTHSIAFGECNEPGYAAREISEPQASLRA
jgi:peptidoglycan/xylan/chitin deacetylase (PgdA/CDA1 family)